MSESYTLEKLFVSFPGGICVPRIQRGYVQGRQDDKGESIFAEFVPVLVKAVFDNSPLSLDFLYGVADGIGEKRRLLPLDGQQRLTTLALLAWLCGKWRKEWHFDYEARRIPQLFMEGLFGDTPPAKGKPSDAIRASSWFLPVWEKDPSVAGMLRMLDALMTKIGLRDCTKANLENITFLLHGIDGTGDTFDHIFRKMNARGKELSPWENMKAMLDKHLDKCVSRERAQEWRDKIDGDWAEYIWKGIGRCIVKLDNALDKIVRMAYARVAGFDAQKATLWEMDGKLSLAGEDKDISKIFQFAAAYFNAVSKIADCWTKARTKNVLWGTIADVTDSTDAVAEFWEWLSNGHNASLSDILRISFLAEESRCADSSRRLRILLNLLDASSIEDNFEDALKAGLDFLAAKLDLDGLKARKAGYSPAQLADEKRKWKLNANRVVRFENDSLVYCGRLQFIGWSDFVDEADVKARLDKVRTAINDDWMGFYRNLASRLSTDKRIISVPIYDYKYADEYWRELILVDKDFMEAVKAWNKSIQVPKEPAWVTHLCELITMDRVKRPALRRYGDDGWVYLLNNDTNRSANSIRLDYNHHERNNRAWLKGEDAKGIRYWGDPWPMKQSEEQDIWFNIVDESWWNSDNPTRFVRGADGEFYPERDKP